MTPDDFDITLRLLAATVVGMIIGADRDLRGRPAGIRTMGLVCLGAAMVAVTATHIPAITQDADALSRVIQGVIQGVMAGIGFLGAGVLVKGQGRGSVKGMTTAAAIWVAAAIGMAAGLASWAVFLIGSALALLLIVVLHPVEVWLENKAVKRPGRQVSDNEQP